MLENRPGNFTNNLAWFITQLYNGSLPVTIPIAEKSVNNLIYYFKREKQ